jgi:hypothetical protein
MPFGLSKAIIPFLNCPDTSQKAQFDSRLSLFLSVVIPSGAAYREQAICEDC